MKNFFRLLVAAVTLVAFVGCENGAEDGKKENRLATPVVNCNVQENTIIVTWESIEFAVYYEVSLNGGEVHKTEEAVYRFLELDYATEYTVSVKAISADETLYLSSETAVQTVTIPALEVPQYREWYSIAPVSAVSNNGRWAVGGFDKNTIIIDLNNNRLEEIQNMEFYDVADNGLAVGSRFRGADDGGTAIYYKDGEYFDVDLGDLPGNLYCSALTGVTPDGTYAVGWFYDFVDDTYYTRLFGIVVPFAYDIVNNRVTVLQADDVYQNVRAATQTTAVAPDHRIIGLEQSGYGMFGVMWADEYAEWEYIYLQVDEDRAPVESFGGVGTTLLSPSGRYVFGKGTFFEDFSEPAAAFNLETKEMMWFPSFPVGSVTAMTDEGVAFLNDVPYGYGTTSFVIETNVDRETSYTLVDWLQQKHSMDLSEYIPEGIIMVGVSGDGRTLVGMTSTVEGYVSFAISLDGKPME